MIVVFSIFLARFSFSGKRNTTAFNLKKKKDDTVEFHHKNTNEHDYNDKHVRTAIGKRDNSNIDANYLSDKKSIFLLLSNKQWLTPDKMLMFILFPPTCRESKIPRRNPISR